MLEKLGLFDLMNTKKENVHNNIKNTNNVLIKCWKITYTHLNLNMSRLNCGELNLYLSENN